MAIQNSLNIVCFQKMKIQSSLLITVGFVLTWLGLLLPTTQFPINDLYQEMCALLAIGVLSLALIGSKKTDLVLHTRHKEVWNIRWIFPSLLLILTCMILMQVATGVVVYLQLGLQVLCCLAIAYIAYKVGEALGNRVDNQKIWQRYAQVLGVLGFAAACQGLVQFFQIDIYSELIFPTWESTRVFGNIRQANYMALFLCLSIWCIASIFKPSSKVAWISVLLILTVMTFVAATTVSRATFGFIAVMLAASVLHPKANRTQKYLSVYVALAVLLFWTTMPVITSFLDFPDIGSGRISMGVNEEIRTLLYSNAWQLSTAHPLFGQGLGNYNYAFTHTDIFPKAKIGSLTNAHNLTLQLAFEYGWAVAVVITLALAYWLVIAWRKLQQAESLVMLGMVLMLAFSSQIEKPLWQLYFLWPTCMWIGWITADLSKAQNTTNTTTTIHKSKITTRYTQFLECTRFDLLFSGIVCILFSITITASYAMLRGLYSPADDFDEGLHQRIQASNKSWFFEPQLLSARALAVTANVRQEDMLIALLEMEQASRYSMTGRFLLRYASLAALAGYPEHAKALVWHTIQCCGDISIPLRQIGRDSNNTALLKLADFAENPVRTSWPGLIRETPKAQAFIKALVIESARANTK